MNIYHAYSNNSRNIKLSLNDKELGELQYLNWFSFKAKIILNNKDSYDLIPKGFFDASIELKKDEEVLISFKMVWKGIAIKVYKGGQEHKFLLKHNTWELGYNYTLLNEENTQIAIIKSKFEWKKFNFNYKIELIENLPSNVDPALFNLTLLHAINYYTQVILAAAGA
ncbi:MAG TPA: hypothetical protein VIL57_06280 [Bacteroidia bacterium]